MVVIPPGVLEGGMGLCMPGIAPLPALGPLFIIPMLPGPPPGPLEHIGPAMDVIGPAMDVIGPGMEVIGPAIDVLGPPGP